MSNNSVYDIRQCSTYDLDKVQHFIDTYWRKGHVLATSRELMDFCHKNREQEGLYNYIIAVNHTTGEIDGIIGFIPTSHYDKTLANEGDVWGAIWKIREDVENDEIKMLGLLLFERFAEVTGLKTYGAIGISKIAKKIYKALRYKTGSLNQYFLLNNSLTHFSIAQNNALPSQPPASASGDAVLAYINDITAVDHIDCLYRPKKSITYFINRYANHPFYHYRFLGVYKDDTLITIFVLRTIVVNGAKVIRIVDLLGEYDTLPNLYDEFQKVLTAEEAEYIDLVNFGMSEESLSRMGFQKLLVEGETIIPNYFEPFERKNVELEFAYKSTNPYMIFKGDSDQDRPNIL